MADTTFTWGEGGQKLSSADLKRRLAYSLMREGTSAAPVNHWMQGAARLTQALLGAYQISQIDKADKANQALQAKDDAILNGSGIFGSGTASAPPAAGSAAPLATNGETGSALPASLNTTESGGNWAAQNGEVGAGGAVGHFGRAQFGQARLQEAANAGAIPQGTTPQMFMQSPELQKAAENWHFADIDQNIRANGFDRMIGQPINGVPITMGGMRAVAHLGGNRGLQRFIETGGRYNPADANGTSLMNYFTTHGGNMRTAQADMPAPGAVPVEFAAGQSGFAIPPGSEDPNALRARAREIQMTDWAEAKRLIDRAAEIEASPPSIVPFAANEEDVQRLEAQMQPQVAAQVAAQNGGALPNDAGNQPLAPVFQTEGTGQPWFGSALQPASSPREAIARVLARTQALPPSRPVDLAMLQADLPAPGAVQAMGQVPVSQPAPSSYGEVDPNSPDGGARIGMLASEEARLGRASGAGIMSPSDGASALAAALTRSPANGTANASAPSTPIQRIATALMPSASAGSTQASNGASDQTVGASQPPVSGPAAAPQASPVMDQRQIQIGAAMRTLNNPNATQGSKLLAQQIIQQAFRGSEFETVTRPDGAVYRVPKSGQGSPVQIFGPQSKPEERTGNAKEYDIYVRQEEAAGRQPETFTNWERANKRAGASSVNVGGGSDKQIFDAFSENTKEARAAANGLTALREARTALTAAGGAITGAGADTKLALQKIGAAFGLGDVSKIENTETFRAAIAPQVAAMLKSTVGSANISNSDRVFAEKAAGGSISLNEGSIRRLLDIMERAGEARLQLHQEQLDAVYPDAEQHKKERALFGVKMPPKAQAAPQSQPGQPARPASKAEFDGLPSGSRFTAPDGTVRIKP